MTTAARPLIADLFCGAGGAAMGLHRAGFDVVGFDTVKQPRYPFPFVQQDALTVDLSSFDAVWASPPCQAYVRGGPALARAKKPKLIEPTRVLLEASGRPWIIENVPGAPLRNWMMLCGTMFGLLILRHRWFELSRGPSFSPFTCSHQGYVTHGDYAAVYGRNVRGPRYCTTWAKYRLKKPPKPAPTWQEAMGIDWMSKAELSQAIPPAYSEYLGRQLLRGLEVA